jgi:hypothetical protein
VSLPDAVVDFERQFRKGVPVSGGDELGLRDHVKKRMATVEHGAGVCIEAGGRTWRVTNYTSRLAHLAFMQDPTSSELPPSEDQLKGLIDDGAIDMYESQAGKGGDVFLLYVCTRLELSPRGQWTSVMYSKAEWDPALVGAVKSRFAQTVKDACGLSRVAIVPNPSVQTCMRFVNECSRALLAAGEKAWFGEFLAYMGVGRDVSSRQPCVP